MLNNIKEVDRRVGEPFLSAKAFQNAFRNSEYQSQNARGKFKGKKNPLVEIKLYFGVVMKDFNAAKLEK